MKSLLQKFSTPANSTSCYETMHLACRVKHIAGDERGGLITGGRGGGGGGKGREKEEREGEDGLKKRDLNQSKYQP